MAAARRRANDSAPPESSRQTSGYARCGTEGLIRYRFGQDDLLRTRFAVSPLFEIVWSAHVLRRPAQAPLHGPWVADARECLAGLDWSMLDWLANGYGAVRLRPRLHHAAARDPARGRRR